MKATYCNMPISYYTNKKLADMRLVYDQANGNLIHYRGLQDIKEVRIHWKWQSELWRDKAVFPYTANIGVCPINACEVVYETRMHPLLNVDNYNRQLDVVNAPDVN
ncbi:hypothetical protein CEXT_246851 [Caerostris extrusa]|uniref:Uncharacterized protein n=1 Tax=Caerostris extrusa TaxID=172846 RepID=A0AAV4WB93_CAEEX|nr:hypothetical protein CEXT_246851 [Caerostris extrusa]